MKRSHSPLRFGHVLHTHLCASPRVHAKMLATGLVLVGLPFWYSRQCRVTVPEASAGHGSSAEQQRRAILSKAGHVTVSEA